MTYHDLGPPHARARADFKSLERKLVERAGVAARTGERTLIVVEVVAKDGEARIFSSVPYTPADGPA